MAIKVKLEKDGFIKDGFVGYSYTSAIFDFWVPAFRLDFSAFVFFFGLYMLEKFLSEEKYLALAYLIMFLNKRIINLPEFISKEYTDLNNNLRNLLTELFPILSNNFIKSEKYSQAWYN